MFDTLVAALTPWITEMLVMLMTFIIAFVADYARAIKNSIEERTNIQIDEKHLNTIYSVMLNAARIAYTKSMTTHEATNFAVEYTIKNAPDAVYSLSPTNATLRNIATAKLVEVAASKFFPK